MSQHPSLRSSQKQKRHRSVLKRYERLKHMKEKELWDEEKDSIFGLPKIKVIKFRVKKEKAAEEAPAEAAAATETAPVAPTKGAAPAKGAAAPAKGAAPQVPAKEAGKEKAAPKKGGR